jgi:hypothetical protein
MNKILLFFFSLFICLKVNAVIVKVDNVIGTAYIVNNVSPNQAKKEALNEAKQQALRKAGVPESISSVASLSTFETNSFFSQYFSEHALIELSGVIKNYEIVKEFMTIKDSIMIEYKIVINAIILMDKTTRDASFNVGINGVKAVYTSESDLSFNVDATQDCFLYVFHKTKDGILLLTPNDLEKENKIKKNQTITYPLGDVSYVLSASQPEEQNIIFVFLKKQHLLNKIFSNTAMSENDFFNWVYQVKRNERIIKGYNFWIVK